ncbi:U3 small nucleolar RNA-associated protein 10 [Musa troglodytarum]|uniref:U3 small nucleolar RNA-associated protein 10 n=1 Tax=Musa troglodytarum TaxID=320322 RepID=A0A9E7EM47_9LILI|nr:U3 small nucleolar RNA-associated protein 10 [Musa troglodytarum]
MSIAAQLQAIRSVLRGTSEVQIRPSVLFDSRAASDIDLKTIFPIALSGLEVLIELDTRFRSYKDSLFSQTSLELNREKMVPKEEEKVNRSICSYLRLLSGYLQLHAALKTLEYLIRRYLVHIYNLDELILCALPFHDTETFVRIVQLLDLGNSKWIFLEGVKASGAPPPRQVVVQQCVRDKGLLETLCNYASPTKEFQHSRPVICFCTAVAVEALGAIPKLDTDTVQRVLGFVFNGLNPAMSGNRDHKAAALMVVGLLATRATLSSKLIQSLIFFIARMAQHDANQSVDLPWLRVIIMALVTLVQSQSKQMLPKKTVLILREIRSEDSLLDTLLVMIEALPSKDLVEIIVSKVLASCMKLSQRMDTSDPHEAGNWGKKILNVLNKHYPCELRGAIRKFLENSRMNLKDEENIVQRFCLMFDGALDMPSEISDSKLWFSLEHPKAVVRQATLSNIAASGILKTIAADPKKLVNVQDAIVRALHDEDLSVVRAALSIDGLARIASLPCLLKAYDHVLSRCTSIFNKNISQTSLACDIAVSCLERMVLEFQSQHLDYSIEVAKMIFPLLLVLPKTWRVNLKALELVDKVKWPFYAEISTAHNSVKFDQMKVMICKEFGSPLKIYQACFLAFKNQWREMELQGCLVPAEEFNVDKFGKSCLELVKHLSSADVEALNCFSVDVQVQSLDLCGTICSLCALPERRNLEEDNYLQLLLGFPSLLVPLTNCDKDIRSSAIHCIQEFYNLWCTFDVSRLKNGNDMILPQFSSSTFRDFLAFIVNEKTLISSDVDFLPSYLTSMLGSSSNNLLAPDNSQNRFDSPAKDGILLFILHSGLKCSLYGKLKILSLLSGMGTLLLNVEGVKSLLIELVERPMHLLSSVLICFPLSSSACLDEEIVECVLRALRVDGFSTNEPAVLEPCVTVLRKLTPVFFDNLKTKLQDELFGNLVILFRNDNGDVRNATREALLRLNINCSTIVRFLELILVQGHEVGSSKRIKRRKHPSHNAFALRQDILCTEESRLSVLMALLDMMLQKKDIKERPFLVKPLFVLLEKIFSDDWLIDLANHGEKEIVSSPEVAESVTSAVYHAQQTTLLILKDISDSLLSNLPLSDNVFSDVKMGLLVEIVRSTDDVTTRNHVFLLLSSITKVYSGWISEHIIDIFAVIGESALKQIFIRALPEVAEPRRLTLMVYLLRILGEESSLGILIFHLFRSLILRITEAPEILRDLNNLFSSVTFTEWEYTFALLRENSGEEEFLLELYLVMQFTVHKLQDTKLVFELESGRDVGYLQTLGLLCETVKNHGLIQKKQKDKKAKLSFPLVIDDNAKPAFTDLCLKIVQLVDGRTDTSDTRVKLAAISSLEALILHPEYALDLDLKTKMKADSVRKLLVVTIPVRLMLTPLRQIYSSALECGESSLSLVFEMLASMISSMDRPAIGTYHVKIFKHCLVALDLRRQLPESIKNINMVERSVIDAMTVLTMKLTETMFRPLFFHSLEWAESEFEGGDCVQSRSLDRSISFYNMVSKLTEHHRSLFVPYFKHLLEGCIRYLTEAHDVNEALAKRRKKAKVADSVSRSKYELLSLKQWHLRAVILKSLYKCFLYDNDLKLLDSTNFQVLLKPIVSQLVIEPPKSLEQTQEVPSVEEVDESLVLCLGQMAITARSDILWKPLNHEVLMQTRNEKIRPKILGLKIVKYLVEHLKEEYLVFLPETIPFLGELLEDAELPVKTLAQEILREMEHLSGESLRQYL